MWLTVIPCFALTLLTGVHAALPDDCTKPAVKGPCGATFQKYYYNFQSHNCLLFTYGGCHGNNNRFSTIQECRETCQNFDTIVGNDQLPAQGIIPNTGTSPISNSGNPYARLNNPLCMGQNFMDMVNKVRAIIGLAPLTTQSGCNDTNSNVCLQPSERGPCRASITKFYYNAATKTCESFVYGGCLGNGNNFKTQQECQDKCSRVSSPGGAKDACSLPPDTGPCRARFTKFYHNPTTGSCEEFVYGGCQGNDNRFESQQECQKRCQSTPSPLSSENRCVLPPETGHCRAHIPSYFYNSTSEACETFVYGGCGGNENRFESQVECEVKCNDVPAAMSKNLCLLPSETGPCRANIILFFHNSSTGMCEEFVYGGCQGNDNRFNTSQECQERCEETSPIPQPQTPNITCLLPPETGPCRANIPSYFYNVTSGMCEDFVYGGCQGNGNRFATQQECQEKCRYPKSSSSSPTSTSSTQPRVLNDICQLPPITGPCLAYFPKYFHNTTSGTCDQFVYGGCQGNRNRFETKQECQERCRDTPQPKSSKNFCNLPPEGGLCYGNFPRYFYNATSEMCENFIYGGCGGNENRFASQVECEGACGGSPSTRPQDVCLLPRETGPCRASITKFFHNSATGTCEQFVYGGCQGNNNRFNTRRECQERCQSTIPTSLPQRPNTTCLLSPETGPCRANMRRYFYNVTSGVCESFVYGGCQGNGNRFTSQRECQERCRDTATSTSSPQPPVWNDTCQLPPITGPCKAYFPRYFYNVTSGTCDQFVYGGCQGNDNRFATQQECQEICRYTSTSSPQPPVWNDTCQLPAITGPCRGYFPRYFHNTTSGTCEQFIYGGCQGNDNNFESPEECEGKCKKIPATRSQDVCLLLPDPGPCFARMPKFYHNATTGRCEEFVYGGCQGNDNRFNSQQECQERCKARSPTSQPRTSNTTMCSLPPQTGPCRASFTKFYYNVANGTCEEFVYGGCQGNDNKFDSRQECQERCGDTVLPSPNITCLLPPESGPCRAYIPSYFHNSTSGTCDTFVYGGCGGNNNRFATPEECQDKCKVTPSLKDPVDICLLRPDTGPCRARIPQIFFNASTGTCQEFVYGGCLGNKNRFDTQQECQERCKGTPQPPFSKNFCNLAPESGPCDAYFPKYFYNATSEMCEEFIYGGCGGNENKFASQVECEEACGESLTTRPQDLCLLPPETGLCRANIPQIYFNAVTGTCEEFIYGGCGGNANRFGTWQECQVRCQSTATTSQPFITNEALCLLQPEKGPCMALNTMFFYNVSTDRCEEFVYGGCQGNENKFVTQQECQERCRDTPQPKTSKNFCNLPPEGGLCYGYFPRYFYNSTSDMCETFIYGGCGGNENRFASQVECEGACGESPSTRSQDVCLLPPEIGPCRGSIPQIYFNAATETCEEFLYGGCEGNDNRFDSQQECQETCKGTRPTAAPLDSNDTCLLPPEPGPCEAYIQSFFHNTTSGTCDQFIYGGCQGNKNRFKTKQECQDTCLDFSQPATNNDCLLPPETGMCRGYMPQYFYNSTSRSCAIFIYGGCDGNNNKFASESECLQTCGVI